MLTREEVRRRIEETGIVPAVRVGSAEDARFAAEAVHHAGISVAEITMTVPRAIEVIADLTRSFPDMVVGGGTILDRETAKRCLGAGATFLTSPGLVMKVVELALEENVVVLPGALTPTEVIAAWEAGADFVKVYPCSRVGGHEYIRALKVPLPQVGLIASGGVSQKTAQDFILAGATALGIGVDLMPKEAILRRRGDHIEELSRRFLHMVKTARAKRSATE